MRDTLSAADGYQALMSQLPLPLHRKAQRQGGISLPPDTVVVSADNHWSLTEDIFHQRFPRRLKHKAPRLKLNSDGLCEWSIEGASIFPPAISKIIQTYDALPGCVNLAARLRDLDTEGIQKEIVFGNAIGAFYAYPDLEVRDWVFRIYNQHLAELQAQAPGRFYGVGLVNYWDMASVRQSMEEVRRLGLKTYLLPIYPKGRDGEVLNYCSPQMAPLWQAAEDVGLPLCFHVGENFHEGPGGVGVTVMTNFGPFRKNLGELIFGGIFDRHPTLQVVFAEADINWVPGALQSAAVIYHTFRGILDPEIQRHPSEYWKTHCFVTFMHDPVGLDWLDIVGADRVMWSSDYPHQESTFGATWSAMRDVVETVGADRARDILGGTARKLFGI